MKIFSVEKFMESCIEDGDTPEQINEHNVWVPLCIGKTEAEIEEMGLLTDDRWMVEVEGEE